MDGFWVRNVEKEHGTKKLIEGKLQPGARVAIVDDVITRGESAAQAIEQVQKHNCEIVLVVALVDRLKGAEELFKQHGVRTYRPVFTIRDFGVEDDAPAAVPVGAR